MESNVSRKDFVALEAEPLYEYLFSTTFLG